MNDKNKIPYCPPLRFPEFKDEWQKTTLGEVAEIKKGVGMSKEQLSNQGNPVILYGELYTTYKSEVINTVYSFTEVDKKDLFITKGGEVIIPSSGETAWDIATARCVIPAGVILGGDLNIIILKKDSGVFLSYLLNGAKRLDIANVAQGSSVVHLYGKELQKLIISLPPTSEQQKIANFLSLIDERIQCVSETIKELKRQKVELVNILIYNLNNKDKPLCLFGEMKNGYPFKSEEYETFGTHRIVTISNVTGDRYLNMDNHKAISNLPSDIQDYQMLSTNDILISLTGNVGRVSLCSKGGDLLNQRVGVFKLYDEFYREYVFQAISDNRFEKTMTALGQGAAQLNIYKKDVEEFIIPVPDNKADVIRISNFLSLIDERIEVEEKLLGQYEKQKKYLLSKMFV